MSKRVIVQPNQTLFDVSLQEYGSIEGAVLLMEANNLDGVTAELTDGQELIVPDEVLNEQVKEYYQDNQIVPASL